MGIDHLMLFVAAGLLLNLTPGPDVLYIVTHALRDGARAGGVAALGISAGCFVHIFAAAIGVSALLAASSAAFTVLKWLGAAYLVFVGLRLLLARAPREGDSSAMSLVADSARSAGAAALKGIFFQGFWTNALNPKVALFFLAFDFLGSEPKFSQPKADPSGATHGVAEKLVSDPNKSNKALAFLLLGLLFNFNGLWVNIGWALASAWLARRVSAVQRGMHWLARASGIMFMGFGLKLALTDNPITQ